MTDHPKSSRTPIPDYDQIRAKFLEGAAMLYRLGHALRLLDASLPLPPDEQLIDLFEHGLQPPEADVSGILGSVVMDELRPAARSLIMAATELPGTYKEEWSTR